MLDNTRRRKTDAQNSFRSFNTLSGAQHVINNLPEPREIFVRAFKECARSNPRSIRYVMWLMVLYLHLGPFSRFVIDQIDRQIAELGDDIPVPHARLHDGAATMVN